VVHLVTKGKGAGREGKLSLLASVENRKNKETFRSKCTLDIEEERMGEWAWADARES
jgi:hypothetical protein